MTEAQWQKWYCDQKKDAMDLKPGGLVLVKVNAFQGKRKIKDRWEDKPQEVVHHIMTDIPSYEVMDQHRQSHILHCNWLLLVASETGVPLCVVSAKYKADVPAPPQLSLLPVGVTARLHHGKMLVWHSPSIRSGEFPGVDQWEAMTSPRDINQSIHWG